MGQIKKDQEPRAKSPVRAKAVAVVRGGILGMSAAGTLAAGMLIKPWESRVYVPYYDVGGILTVCDGHTGSDIIPGQRYSDAECDALLAQDVNAHEAGLDGCLLTQPPIETKAAYISFFYNVGVNAGCRSTLIRLANAGRFRESCEQLSKWVYVKGSMVNGLVNRRVRGDDQRISERTLCMIGVDPQYKTPLFEKVYMGFKNWKSARQPEDV